MNEGNLPQQMREHEMAGPPATQMAEPPPPGEEQPTPLFKRMHMLLRGRYHWAVLLGLLGAAAGVVGGYFAVTPVYKSTALIQVEPYLPRILYESEVSKMLPDYDGFVKSQLTLMQSRRVRAMALEDPAWEALGRSSSLEAQDAFLESLELNHPRGSRIISVAYEDPDRQAAEVGVQALVRAYMEIYGERERNRDQTQMRVLEDRKQSLSQQIKDLNSRILAIANEYGTDALDQNYQFKLEELHKIESTMRRMQRELAFVEAGEERQQAEAAEAGEQAEEAQPLTAEDIAGADPEMADLLARQRRLREDIELLGARLGDRHRNVQSVRDQLAVVERSIEEKVAQVNEAGRPALAGDSEFGQMSPAQIRNQVEQIRAMYEEAREETLALGRRKLEIDNLRDRQSGAEKRLEETEFRIEQLSLESAGRGRVDLLPGTDTSVEPVNQRKQYQMMGAGLFGGAGAGVGIVLLFGMLDRRLRNSDEAYQSMGHLGMLGVLPHMPEDLSDPDEAADVAHSVHHIRTLLQLGTASSPSDVYTITSASAGSGKTSLTLALGMSFADSGCRTLLVDCDFTSGGLSRRMATIVRRRIGHILERRGLVSSEQLQEALSQARQNSQRLGEVLIELGHVTQEDLDEALAYQEQTAVGLLDSLAGDQLEHCIAETGTPNLSILPVGGATVADVRRISPAGLKRVLREARQKYDVILVDTGPVPGSMETSAVAAAADAVVFVAAHGDSKPAVQRGVDFLASLNARLAGFVFNRASARDAAVWNYSATSQRPTEEELAGAAGQPARRRIGPVAGALASNDTGNSRGSSNGSNGNGHVG
ncbi:MAG: GumC family protein [Phycisphaeraceae bacterium]